MDDFDEIQMQRQRNFIAGYQKGLEQANAYDMHEKVQQGQQFGEQFVKELAMYESFLQTFEKLKIGQQLKNPKSQELAAEMRNLINQINYQSLQVLRHQRANLQKKFEVFMAMLGIKKAATRALFEIKRVKVSIDF